MNKALLIDLPITDYLDSLALQHQLVEDKLIRKGPDVLLLLEHPPTITLGKRAAANDVLAPEAELSALGVAVRVVDRGGRATYHGPGQLVGYPIIDVKSRGLKIREYVQLIEGAIIGALESFGVSGFRKTRSAGVWTAANDKIASIGLRIKRGIAYHGFSLNVSMASNVDRLIVLCGEPGTRMVNLVDLTDARPDMTTVKEVVARSFARVFESSLEPSTVKQALGNEL